MLLNIYLATTAISWATTFIFSAACNKKLDREGYKLVKEKKSISEKIASFLSTAFKGSIPVRNILNTVIILCMGVDKVYEHGKDQLLEEGKIYMHTEEISSSENGASPREEAKTYTESMKKSRAEKKYDGMTLDEKISYLEREREILTGQPRTIVEQTIVDEGQEGLGLKKTMNPKQK